MKKFSEIEYKRPDFEALRNSYATLMERFKKAKTYEEARELFLAIQHADDDAATMATVASIRNTADLSDKFYEDEDLFISGEFAKLAPFMAKVNKAIVKSKFRSQLEEEFGNILFMDAEMSIRLTTSRNVPLSITENKLRNEYSKAVGLCSTDFRGEKCNFYGLLKHMESTDRDERREAFEAWAKMYEEVSPKLDKIYDRLVRNRCSKARNLGFDSYIDYIYPARGRYDYTAKDVADFRELVRKYITPFCDRFVKMQAKKLGIDKVKYYDEALFYPEGNPTPHGSKDEMVAAASKMYHEMSPESGEFFDFMVKYDLFDLETRPNKHMGGYCTELQAYKAPFIFSNFNGTAADVDVLTHEAGHAFEAYLAMREQKIPSYAFSTSEINEIHSMSMEHFAYPWMKLFFGDDVEHRIFTHLYGAISCIPYLVCVDEFQHRVFEKPDMTHDERYAAWRDIEQKYMPWRDYDGNEFLEKGGFWMQKQHIFLYPFYYIDYALAQTCAFMLYKRMCENREQAWSDYLRLCRAGGSKGYFELLEVGNLKKPFDEQTFAETIGFVENALEGKY